MRKKQALRPGAACAPPLDTRAILDELACVFWWAAVAELEAELDQTSQKRTRKARYTNSEARL